MHSILKRFNVALRARVASELQKGHVTCVGGGAKGGERLNVGARPKRRKDNDDGGARVCTLVAVARFVHAAAARKQTRMHRDVANMGYDEDEKITCILLFGAMHYYWNR